MLGAVASLVASLLGASPATAQLSDSAVASVEDTTLTWDQTTTVRGTGWLPGAAVEVILYAGGHRLATPTVAGDGSFTASVRIPSRIASSTEYRIVVQGPAGDGAYGYQALRVTIAGPEPTFSLSSDELRWDQSLTVTGDRYQPGTEVQISLLPDSIELGRATVDGGDRFSATVRIPSGLRSSASYFIAVTGEGIDRLFHFDNAQVTILGEGPTIALDATRVARDGELGVSGARFAAGTSVRITLLPSFDELGSAPVGPDGTFSRRVALPGDLGAERQEIVVTGTGADGFFAYLSVDFTIVGAEFTLGSVREGEGADPRLLPGASTTTSSSTTSTTRPGATRAATRRSGGGASGQPSGLAWIVLLLCLLVVAAIVLSNDRSRAAIARWWRRTSRRVRGLPPVG